MTKNHAHIQNSGNSRVRLNSNSEVKANQEQETDAQSLAQSDTRTEQVYPTNNMLNTELLASLLPLLNKLVRDNQQ